jgi:hypothetical protein
VRSAQKRSAVLVRDFPATREIVQSVVEPLTLAFALSCGIVGALLGWEAHGQAWTSGLHPRSAATYVDAMCRSDVAYLQRNTGEAAGPMPWEPRLSTWSMPCKGQRYLGSSTDRIGREQHVFTLLQQDGTEVLFVVTFGHDGLVAGID